MKPYTVAKSETDRGVYWVLGQTGRPLARCYTWRTARKIADALNDQRRNTTLLRRLEAEIELRKLRMEHVS